MKKTKLMILATTLLFALGGCQSPSSSGTSPSSPSDTSHPSSADSGESSSGETSTPSSEEEGAYSITVEAEEGVDYLLSRTKADAGEEITLTITIEDYFILKDVTANDSPLTVIEGVATFTMPESNVAIFIDTAEAHKVSFEENANVEAFTSDGKSFYEAGSKVTLGYRNLADSHYFDEFTADGVSFLRDKDNDYAYYFIMPEADVAIKAVTAEKPAELEGIANDYVNGYLLSSNSILDGYRLEIRYDRTINLFLDWSNPLFTGEYAVNGKVLSASLSNEGNTYAFTADLSRDGLAECTFALSSSANDYYLFALESATLEAKALYTSYKVGAGARDRLFHFVYGEESFFSYLPEEGGCYFHLDAYIDQSSTIIDEVEMTTTYQLKDGENEVTAFQFDGYNISTASSERGSYTLQGADSLFLDGFNKVVIGNRNGTYTYTSSDNIVVATFGEEVIRYTIDPSEKTYTVEASPVEGEDPFIGTTFNGTFRVWDEDYYNNWTYDIALVFGETSGTFTSISITCSGWSAPYIDSTFTNSEASYTYDESTLTMVISIVNSSKTYPLTSNANHTQLTVGNNGIYIYSEAQGSTLKKA